MLGWELPPHNSGGLGIACYQLCKSLAKKEVDLEFVVPYQADHKIDFMKVTAAHPQDVVDVQRAGIAYDSDKYTYSDGHTEYLSIFEQQQMFEKSVEKMVETTEVDILHAHDWLTFRAALRVKELKNCPIILHVHSVESDRAGGDPGNPMVRDIEETALHLADRVIAVSDHTKQCIIRDYGVPAEKIEVVHNSIEIDDDERPSEENAYKYLTLMKSLGYRVVVNVGRLTIQKGLPNLLYAAQKVVSVAPKTLFLIVGSGNQYHELVEMSAGLGIGANVLFTDFQRGKNWRDAFSIGDLFVMPSISEPFGLTPLEAIGYGTPVLISKQSGVGEKLQNCLKVDFWDIDEMANQIASVMLSDPLRNELLRNSHREYENFSWDEASDSIVKLYHKHHQAEMPA